MLASPVREAPALPLPRVLFVTAHAFNRCTGGGVTFSNLFQGWPKDSLATVHCDVTPVATDVCERYFKLSADELRPWGPLHYLRSRAQDATTGGGGATDAPGPAEQALRGAKRLVLGDYSPETARLSPALERWIDEFRPQVLYTILGSNGMMELIDQIRGRFELPLVVHFMDDWPSAVYQGGLASPFQRRRMWRHLRRLVGAASVRMGISPAMCAAFAAQFGTPFEAFHNGIDIDRLAKLAAGTRRASAAPTIAYSGAILPFAQLDSLAAVGAAVAALRRAGHDLRFAISCPPAQAELYRPRLASDPGITVTAGDADWESYYRRLCAADVLVLPVNFDAGSIAFIRYSMPTKVAEYLASGVPILVYGPRGVAQVDEAARFGWAHVVSTPEPQALAHGIAALTGDRTLRERLVAAARRHAAERFDLAGLQARFRKAMTVTVRPEPTP